MFQEHELPLLRILTDRGTEYRSRPEQHDYQLYLAINDIDHTTTKAKSSQTNGICERFHKTVLDQFYRVAFRNCRVTAACAFCVFLRATLSPKTLCEV